MYEHIAGLEINRLIRVMLTAGSCVRRAAHSDDRDGLEGVRGGPGYFWSCDILRQLTSIAQALNLSPSFFPASFSFLSRDTYFEIQQED